MAVIRIHEIIERLLAYDPQADADLVNKAYVWSATLHKGQLRASGLPYLSHPLEVAGILTELRLNAPGICAGLLHDTLEDSSTTLDKLTREFGKEIAGLVDGVTKISMISRASRPQAQAENFRKMILAMAEDIRVILIKLADRLHNMRTIDYLPEARRFRMAEETLEIYAPLASRLGIYWIKSDLEDLSFRILKPDLYFRLVKQVAQIHRAQQAGMEEVQSVLRQKLAAAGIEAQVEGRHKPFYSIYHKMETHKLSLDQVHDLVAFRILCQTIRECYEALYVIHSFWAPVPGRIKDYIALPKPNMYQSLHTTVIGPGGQRVEIQIRTQEMHRVAEFGIAAHWRYKEGGALAPEADDKTLGFVKRLVELQKELHDPHQFLESVKSDLFPDEVFVFTPKGDLRELPKGASPIDFAFSIHSAIGYQCAGARVNGRIVPLNYNLQSGETVEIITSRDAHPVKAWLDLAKTAQARNKIQHWLHGREVGSSEELGRQILEADLLRYNIHLDRAIKSGVLGRVAKQFKFTDHQKLLQAIGYGKFPHRKVLARMVPHDRLRRQRLAGPPSAKRKAPAQAPAEPTLPEGGLVLQGFDDPLIEFGACCSPLPGDEIVAFTKEGQGVEVHRPQCARAREADPDRLVPVHWGERIKGIRPATIEVVSADRPGLLAQMGGAISEAHGNISRALVRTTDDEKAINTFEVEVKSAGQLRRMIKKLEKIEGVISVERLEGGLGVRTLL